ncbi:MAG: metallophosphoesterase family protein [Parachlamydiales bacterium]|nr:metallophosphoesterase family protein [Parachlamydiales bacterium]
MWRYILLLPFSIFANLSALYLSWYGDPTTTMTIQWHTPATEYGDSIWIETLDQNWEEIEGEHAVLDSTLIHKVHLDFLDPGTEYRFRIGSDPKIYRFKTAPASLDEGLRFIIGGDVYANTKLFRRMSQTVLENDPHFVVLGGDIAYAITIYPFRTTAIRKWLSFLRDWKDYMIASDGTIIPFLIVPGNHDITPDNYDLFFTLFAFPEKQLYRTIDFGSYLTLFLLDTGHFQPIEGRQTLWLEKALSARSETPYRFAIYHEAAYPSYYPYHGLIPKKIRANWVPLFEKYRLHAAFENHNHAFKRTHPMKAGQIDPTGIVYLGDGGWGAPPRSTNNLWYLANRQKKNSILLVSLTSEQADIQALDLLNQPLDQVTLSPYN